MERMINTERIDSMIRSSIEQLLMLGLQCIVWDLHAWICFTYDAWMMKFDNRQDRNEFVFGLVFRYVRIGWQAIPTFSSALSWPTLTRVLQIL